MLIYQGLLKAFDPLLPGRHDQTNLSRFLWELYNHAAINTRRLFVRKYPPLSIVFHEAN